MYLFKTMGRKFQTRYFTVHWSDLYSSHDPDKQYNCLIDIITDIYNKHFPILCFHPQLFS